MIGTVGIVGCSAPGAALCFETICKEAQRELGIHAHPEISLNILPFAEHVTCVQARDWEGLARMLLHSVERLRAAGADFVICPDNTAHVVFDRVAGTSRLPWIHIADAVTAEAVRRGYRRVGLLGTRALLASKVYDGRLVAQEISVARPTEAESEALDALIFGDLSRGEVTPRGRALLGELVGRLRVEERCEAVVLGCTELPLLLDPRAPLSAPTLDSTRLLARAAIQRAIAMDRGARATAAEARP